ncbi:MAG TPA: hypothetical protein VNL94_06385 [Candidatus Binatia bacterium]|nr:hypothetical protein [Candidatus Binatia bacterium]
MSISRHCTRIRPAVWRIGVARALALVAPVAGDEPVRGNILVPIERVAPGMRRLIRTLGAAAVLTLAAVGASPALADSPSNGQLIVPGDHINPGETFSITGYDIDPLIELDLAIVSGGRTAELGTVKTDGAGNLSASVQLPSDFPTGYANVMATSVADGQWTTAVLVGERAEGPNAQPGSAPPDDRVVGLLLAGIGTVLFLIAAAWYVRTRPSDSATR